MIDHRDQASVDRALTLIKENVKDEKLASLDDRRAQAHMQAKLPGRTNAKAAAEMFEALLPKNQAPGQSEVAEDRFVLATLYEYLKEKSPASDKARWGALAAEQYRSLMFSNPNDPRYLAYNIRFLLSREEVDEASLYFQELHRLAPNDVATIALSAEILRQQEQYDKLLPLIEKFVDDPVPGKDEHLVRRKNGARTPGGSCASDQESGQRQASTHSGSRGVRDEARTRAEQLAREDADERPRDAMHLAALYTRQSRQSQSLEILEEKWPLVKPEEVTIVTSALLVSPTTSAGIRSGRKGASGRPGQKFAPRPACAGAGRHAKLARELPRGGGPVSRGAPEGPQEPRRHEQSGADPASGTPAKLRRPSP